MPDVQPAQVLFHASVEKVTKKIPPGSGKLEAVDEHTSMLYTGAYSLDAIAVHLALTGLEFEVREPPELIEHMRLLAERLRRAAG
jgi:hypothetical protein